MRSFARYAWSLLSYDIAVVAWGAYVRASGSGAGCGQHWPLCNGQILVRAARVETLVELSHRLSSGASLVFTAVLLYWAVRAFPAGHRARRAAWAAMAFMVGEALIGAGLVLFRLVEHDQSVQRALGMGLHLVNTFFLLASMALTAYWASSSPESRAADDGLVESVARSQRAVTFAAFVPLVALLVVGATGSIAALGDTLFPASSIAAGIAQDFAPRAHVFLRLRALHPILAVTTAGIVIVGSAIVSALRTSRDARWLSRAARLAVIVQVAAGLLDLATRAAVWMQLVHVVLADVAWTVVVLMGAAALAERDAKPIRGAVVPVVAAR